MQKTIVWIMCFVSTITFAQKPIFTAARVKGATVYFNSAELSQTTVVNLPTGTSEIVVKNVANYLNENSVQIGAPANVTVLSVQFTNDYMSEYDIDENSPAIRKVRDSINLVQKELARVSNTKNSELKTIELLDKNQQVFGQNSGLNVIELTKMVDYYKSKRTELSNSINTLEEKEKKYNAILSRLNTKLEIDSSKEEKTSSGKLVLQLMNNVAGLVPLEISYVTPNASWSPFYDLRAESVKEPINMLYKAQVIQNTGIDWKKVKLTLSSGNPNQSNQAPILSSWFLRYGYPNYAYKQQNNITNQLEGKAAGVNVNGAVGASDKIVIRGISSIASSQKPLIIINDEIASYEVLEQITPENIKSRHVLKGADAIALYGSAATSGAIIVVTKQMNDYTDIQENQLNVSFDIDLPYDILSNGKAHSVVLKEMKLPATYKYYAVPKMEKEAFLLAEIKEYGKYNLLPGEANIIFEGMYVGKTQINPSQTADTLNLSMGRDKKITIKREKVVDKSGTKFLSSKKEQTFTYDITLRNNKKEAVYLLLKDQYPLSSDKEIEIELLEKEGAKTNVETGVLTWDINLKPNETKKIRISYVVKYPKDKVIGNL